MKHSMHGRGSGSGKARADCGRRISRRTALKLGIGASALTIGALPAQAATESTHGPGWYTNDKLTGEITVYTFSGQRWELPARGVLPLFAERFPNVKVNITAVPISEGMTKLMLIASSKSPNLDTILIDAGELQAVYNVGAMAPLADMLQKDPGWLKNYADEVPAEISKNYRIPQKVDGSLYGLTCDGNSHIMFYRRDLFDQAGLKVPENWDESLEVAKALNKPDKSQYGFICFARRGFYAGLCFQQLFFTNGGRHFDAEQPGGWHPQYDNDKGRIALETLLKLMKYAHPVSLNAVDDEVNTALANGSAVFAPFMGGTTILNDAKYTKFYKDFAADQAPRNPVPGGNVAILAGFGMYINSASNNKDAAFEFLKHLNSGDYVDSRIGEAYVKNFGQPTRLPLLQKYEDMRPHFAALRKSFQLPLLPVVPFIPEGVTMLEAVGNETSAVLAAEKKIDAALAAMNASVTKIMADGGYYK